MNRSNEIETGDKVTVRIQVGQEFDGIVKYMPCATGDSWHIRELRCDGSESPILHYVQTFAEIIRYGG